MNRLFVPYMKILSPAQKRVWPELRPASRLGLVLYGGTAVALRLGHRFSVDFDFFTDKPLDKQPLRSSFPFMGGAWGSIVRFDTISRSVENRLAVAGHHCFCNPLVFLTFRPYGFFGVKLKKAEV